MALSYRPLFDADAEDDPTTATGASIPLQALNESPNKRRHGQHAKESSEEQGYDSDEEEVLALMARGSRERERGEESDKSHEHEGPLFKGEDLDIDSAMAMVHRVSTYGSLLLLGSSRMPSC